MTRHLAARTRRVLPVSLAALLALPVLTAVSLPAPDPGPAPPAATVPAADPVAALEAATDDPVPDPPDVRPDLDLDAMPFLDGHGEYDPAGDASIVDDPLPLEHVVMGEDHTHDHGDDGHATGHHGVHVHVPAHGDDAATTTASAGGAALPATRRPLVCEPNGGYRTVVVYAHLRGQPEDRGRHLGTIRSTMERSNQMVARSARASGGPLADLRTRCTSGGAVSVATAEVTSRDFGQIKTQLARQGFDQRHEKYLIFADFAHGTRAIAGLADLFHDTRRSVHNHNNGNHAMYAVVYGPSNFTGSVALHELTHAMGATQRGAPRADAGGHCTYSGDLLCRGGASSIVMDRGNDTYFSTDTRSGQWLHHHWNLGWEGNRFVRVAGRPTPNLPPTAAFSVDCVRATCTFDASGSSDPDGRIVRYRVDVDGQRLTGRVSRHTFPANGTYEATLTVTDDRGATATATRSVRVSGATAPTARASIACDELTCTLDARGSTDRDGGTIEGYRWRLEDGRTSTRAVWTVTFEEVGTHRVELTVTDDDGWTGTTTSTAVAVSTSEALSSLTDALDGAGDGALDAITDVVPELDVDLPSTGDLEASLDVRVGDIGADLALRDARPKLGVDLGGGRVGLLD